MGLCWGSTAAALSSTHAKLEWGSRPCKPVSQSSCISATVQACWEEAVAYLLVVVEDGKGPLAVLEGGSAAAQHALV